MPESDAVDPTERINFVQCALLEILEAFPPHENTEPCQSIERIITYIDLLMGLKFPNPKDEHQMKLLSRLEEIGESLPDWCTAAQFPIETESPCCTIEHLSQLVLELRDLRNSRKHIYHDRGQDPDEVPVLDFQRFERLPRADNAHYQRSGTPACLDGTRQNVLNRIEGWARDPDPESPPIYWLNGLAGTGKSAIARTIAERISDGASFFCSRDPKDPNRRNPSLLFPTLGAQLALKHPKFMSRFKAVDPLAPYYSVEHQMRELIITPLRDSGIANQVIVIDGLDEFRDEETVSTFLSALRGYAGKMRKLGLRFLITSRPEVVIRMGFRKMLPGDIVTFSLQEVGLSEVNEDIRLFFKHEFLKPNNSQGEVNGWLDPGALELLCQRTAGLFFYAVTAVRSINNHFKTSRDQLDLQQLLDNMNLDSLYMPIIQEVFIPEEDLPEEDLCDIQNKLRSVFGAIVLAPSPLSPSTIGALLDLPSIHVLTCLRQCHSILIIKDKNPVQTLHQSISTFFTDPSKSDQFFYIYPPTHHKNLLIACLKLMNEGLQEKMHSGPDVATGSVGKDGQHIDPTLVYACKSWHKHFAGAMLTVDFSGIDHLMIEFQKKASLWEKVLNIIGAEEDLLSGKRILEEIVGKFVQWQCCFITR